MIKPSTFLKATATTLTACILAACGGDSSDDNDSVKETSQVLTTNTHTFTISYPENSAQEGKSVFNLNIKDSDGTSVTATTPKMMPMMAMGEAMGGHNHSTPHTGCTETDSSGNAECTAYFLMASKMESGMAMGKWSLTFSLADVEETVTYSPEVAINSKAKGQLKGGMNDKIPKMSMGAMAMAMDNMDMGNMAETESRTYSLFNNGVTTTGDTSSVEIFLAAKESMMSFPTLKDGAILNEGTDNELTIDSQSIVLKVSGDNTNWTSATSQGAGIWVASEVANISNKLYLSLSVNGEVKTTDGEMPSETDGISNSSAIITLKADEEN